MEEKIFRFVKEKQIIGEKSYGPNFPVIERKFEVGLRAASYALKN